MSTKGDYVRVTIMALFLVMGLMLVAAPVLAGAITLTCTAPTQNTDGTPLIDLEGIKFYESQTAGGSYTNTGESTTCSFQLDRPAGTYYFVATAYNTAGIESAYSNEVQKIVPPSIPSPPSGLAVAGNLVAYGLQQSPDVVTTFPVGSVDSGTECDPTMSVNGKYRVPLAAVTYAGSVRPVVVFAECSGG